ncbi:MAG: hypothetical protein ABSE51_12240 [Terracidiphilus sp.]|jgi:hypothetical protein
MDASRRDLMKAAAVLLVDGWAGSHLRALGVDHGLNAPKDSPKVIVVTCGGIRRAETFHESGFQNIPHLYSDLLPQSIFYTYVRNDGVTSHFNTISSILTGSWQRVDDWGKTPPTGPTVFEAVRKRAHMPSDDAWLISSNKALTSQIGASSLREYGPRYGANVIFPKQLLISAVVNAASEGRVAHTADRAAMQQEIAAMLEANNYEGLGWSSSGENSTLDASTHASVLRAIDDLVRTNAPVTGDEFTLLVSMEVMRRFAPSLLAITFSDMEVAHFGSYSLHLSGIRTVDRLVYELWNEVQTNSAYRGRTTLFVLPEFGRDLDGSNTNGFFNHRQNNDSTRLAWMMCLGEAVKRPTVIERPAQHIDLCPTIASLFGVMTPDVLGQALPEIRV